MASLGLAFGAWGLPWESGDAPGIGESGDARMLLLRGRRRRLLLEQTSPGLAAPGSEKQKWAFK